MFKKIFIFLIILSIIILLNECIPCNPKDTKTYYEIIGISSETLELKEKLNYNQTYYYYEKQYSDNILDTYHFYGIDLIFHDSVTSIIDLKANLFNGINSLYACSENENNTILSKKIDFIKISTLYDFDSLHLAGSDITKYFYIINDIYSNKDSIFPIDTKLNEILSYYYNGTYGTQLYDLKLILLQRSSIDSMLKFEIKVFNGDLKIFTTQTQEVQQL